MADAPIGTVVAFAGVIQNTGDVVIVQDVWALCNGAAALRDLAGKFGQLFKVIGDFYGVGDGVNTFNLPDYRGQFLRGADLGAKIDKDFDKRTQPPKSAQLAPDKIGSIQPDQFGQHTHPISPNPPPATFPARNQAPGNNGPAVLGDGAGGDPTKQLTVTTAALNVGESGGN